MSWKSFVSAGLLCVLASPAFAAPTVSAINGAGGQASGYLNTAGNWVAQVRVAPSNPIPTGSTALAAELGFNITSVRPGSAAGNVVTPVGSLNNNVAFWDTPNPGEEIFGWEVEQDVDPGAGVNMKPVGVQRDANQIFAAVGSAVTSSTSAQNFLRIEVQRPSTNAAGTLSTLTLQLRGAYDASGNPVAPNASNRARVAESTGATTSINYHYTGTVTFNAKGGDTNLDGQISPADVSAVLGNFNVMNGSRQWYHGDFNGDNNVSPADVSQLLGNFGAANNYTVLTGSYNLVPPPGGGSGSAIPEPASVVLIALSALGLAGLRRRR